MTKIFTLESGQTPADGLLKMTRSRLNQIFGTTIMQRSYSYIEQIDDVNIYAGGAETTVFGTEGYDIEVKFVDQSLFGSCTCPYGGLCKHLAAFVQYLSSETDEDELDAINPTTNQTNEIASAKDSFDFDNWLQGRSKTELIDLVKKYAPPSFRQSLALQQEKPDVVKKEYEKAADKVRNLLKNADKYSGDEFEKELIERLDNLKSFWLSLPSSITDLLAIIIKTVDDAQEEGHLYDHYDDGGFEGNLLGTYMANFTASTSGEDFSYATQKIMEAIRQQLYGISQNYLSELAEMASTENLSHLKTMFLQQDLLNLQEEYYKKNIWERIEPILNTEEQIQLLTSLKDNNSFLLKLANLLEQNKQVDKAIYHLDKELSTHQMNNTGGLPYHYFSQDTNKLYEKRVELEEKYEKGKKTKNLIVRYIKYSGQASSLHFGLKYLPDAQKELENWLLSTNKYGYATYLEDSKRLEEVVAFFKIQGTGITHQTKINFFKKHKKSFPKEAQTVFLQSLHEELPTSKNRSYEIVVDCLVQLRTIMPPEEFLKMVNDIKVNYKRRSSMMGMLVKEGL